MHLLHIAHVSGSHIGLHFLFILYYNFNKAIALTPPHAVINDILKYFLICLLRGLKDTNLSELEVDPVRTSDQRNIANSSVPPLYLQRTRAECMRIMKRLKDRPKSRRGGAVRTEARQVLPHPAGGQVP